MTPEELEGSIGALLSHECGIEMEVNHTLVRGSELRMKIYGGEIVFHNFSSHGSGEWYFVGGAD